ncbi:MAG TPA: dUTP diphosphatase [Chitinophagaceae bacterium]|nr:dUTP diphosphatase [Chitinophagaceae bacterium]
MQEVVIKIINKSGNALPEYATSGAAGMDIRAHLPEPVVLQPLQRAMIPTGIFMEIPAGYEVQVRPRSGLAHKHGITCLNAPGTVDSDYRGELKVILINLSSEVQTIYNSERIAQLVVSKVERAQWYEVEQLETTMRGEGGFGHTGKN